MTNFFIRGYGSDAMGQGLSYQKHEKKLDDRLKNRGTAKNRRPSKMYAESGPRSGSRVDQKITKLANEILAARRARRPFIDAKKEELKKERQSQKKMLEDMGLGNVKDGGVKGFKGGGAVMKGRGGSYKGCK
tara:strand:+ start:1210 stop:1605 length:396 start_codon:yes stop_codon:yes gene_type:complete